MANYLKTALAGFMVLVLVGSVVALVLDFAEEPADTSAREPTPTPSPTPTPEPTPSAEEESEGLPADSFVAAMRTRADQLDTEDVRWETDGEHLRIYGYVVNNGERGSFHNVKLQVWLLDWRGFLVGKGQTYAVMGRPLLPGSRRQFEYTMVDPGEVETVKFRIEI